MTITDATPRGKTTWNNFIREHYPQIGAFMQTWEWGEFQKNMGRRVERRYILQGETPIAAFMYARHALFLPFSYHYAPRGPVIKKNASETQIVEVFKTIQSWARENLRHSIFLRLEPPLNALPAALKKRRNLYPRIFPGNTINEGVEIYMPPQYIQPRYNLAIPLDASEEEMRRAVHSSTRSNLNRAERRGVTIAHVTEFTSDTHTHFTNMMHDTIQRNSGTNAYPNQSYFHAFLKTIPRAEKTQDANSLTLAIIHGLCNGAPAATHLVVYFGGTATYLYGAAYTKHLSSKVTTYLHWQSALEAKRRGMRYYDVGGIDEVRWPTLTAFKRQFRGKEFAYIGTIDIPLKKNMYYLYTMLKKIRGYKSLKF